MLTQKQYLTTKAKLYSALAQGAVGFAIEWRNRETGVPFARKSQVCLGSGGPDALVNAMITALNTGIDRIGNPRILSMWPVEGNDEIALVANPSARPSDEKKVDPEPDKTPDRSGFN